MAPAPDYTTRHHALRAMLDPQRWPGLLEAMASMTPAQVNNLQALPFDLIRHAHEIDHAEDAMRAMLALRPDWANESMVVKLPGHFRVDQPPLIDATWRNRASLVEVLLQCGADPAVKTAKGLCIIEVAATPICCDTQDSTRTLEFLIARLDPPAEQLERALWQAAYAGHLAATRVLLAAGANLGAVVNGITVLMAATTRQHTHIAGCLLDAGADPNARGVDGDTALHQLARAWVNNPDHTRKAAAQLLAAGADTNATNDRGQRAIDIARTDGQHAMVSILSVAELDAGTTPGPCLQKPAARI